MERPPGQNQVPKVLKSKPGAPSGTKARQRRATTSEFRLGSKVDKTRFKSVRLITPGVPVFDRQNPLKTSSRGRPDLLTALRTRPRTCSASAGVAPICPDAEPAVGLSNPITTSSSSASLSLPLTKDLNKSVSSAALAPKLKDDSPDTKSSRLIRPRPMAARCRKNISGVSPCTCRRCRMLLTSSACRESPKPAPKKAPMSPFPNLPEPRLPFWPDNSWAYTMAMRAVQISAQAAAAPL